MQDWKVASSHFGSRLTCENMKSFFGGPAFDGGPWASCVTEFPATRTPSKKSQRDDDGPWAGSGIKWDAPGNRRNRRNKYDLCDDGPWSSTGCTSTVPKVKKHNLKAARVYQSTVKLTDVLVSARLVVAGCLQDLFFSTPGVFVKFRMICG